MKNLSWQFWFQLIAGLFVAFTLYHQVDKDLGITKERVSSMRKATKKDFDIVHEEMAGLKKTIESVDGKMDSLLQGHASKWIMGDEYGALGNHGGTDEPSGN